MTVAPGPIVKDFNVIKDVVPRQISGFVDTLANTLLLQAAKEGFCNSVRAAL